MTRNDIRWNHPLGSWECEDSDTAIISARADSSNVGASMLWHLAVDFGLGAPLHFVAPREAAIAFARESTEGGWARSAAVDQQVDESYPAMPCQRLYPVQSAADRTRSSHRL